MVIVMVLLVTVVLEMHSLVTSRWSGNGQDPGLSLLPPHPEFQVSAVYESSIPVFRSSVTPVSKVQYHDSLSPSTYLPSLASSLCHLPGSTSSPPMFPCSPPYHTSSSQHLPARPPSNVNSPHPSPVPINRCRSQ
ncbi:hypothetical protein E2C01_058699 [Portunus trituberculatus]|uniref:Uncharacterized protein n=1 Tax=Portunus trituberculatus TaxID=210409 RepID=A0A5B7GW96_PORTR|nr:hypothetical protein [Portunus trituberculatus]